MSQIQQQRKFYPCRKGCGTQVTFDNRFKNHDGTKFVPLVQDTLGQLSPHDCKIKKQQQQEPVTQSSLEQKLDHLIAEVQALRIELQKRK